MTEGGHEHLTEEEAARLWQRAAQLQAEAAERVEREEGSRALASGADRGNRSGYALEHVRSAAIEAGIGAEYLDAALVDLQVERDFGQRGHGRGLARRFLDDPPDAITVTRIIDAPSARILGAMETVFGREPYNLTLKDRRGDALNGGLLVFDINGAGFLAVEVTGFARDASWADLRQVFVTVRPLSEGEGARCEVTQRGPIAWAQGLNAAIGGGVVTLVGGVGLALSWPLGGAIGGALWAAGVIAPAGASAVGALVSLVGAGIVGRIGLGGVRFGYAWSLGRGRKAMEGLLSVVAAHAQGGWGLARTEPVEGSP